PARRGPSPRVGRPAGRAPAGPPTPAGARRQDRRGRGVRARRVASRGARRPVWCWRTTARPRPRTSAARRQRTYRRPRPMTDRPRAPRRRSRPVSRHPRGAAVPLRPCRSESWDESTSARSTRGPYAQEKPLRPWSRRGALSCGAKGTRSPDPHTASVVRYQLRHSPVFTCCARPLLGDRLDPSYTTAVRPSKSTPAPPWRGGAGSATGRSADDIGQPGRILDVDELTLVGHGRGRDPVGDVADALLRVVGAVRGLVDPAVGLDVADALHRVVVGAGGFGRRGQLTRREVAPALGRLLGEEGVLDVEEGAQVALGGHALDGGQGARGVFARSGLAVEEVE